MSIFEDSINDVYKKGFFEIATAGCDMYNRVKPFYKSVADFKHPVITDTNEQHGAIGEHLSNISHSSSHYDKVRPAIPPKLQHKQAIAYHTEPPKRNYNVSDIQLRTPFNSREFDDLNEDFIKAITENYSVRSMSEVARQYGFYSVFFVGEEHTYFVYGIDNEFLNTAEFIEHDDTLLPYEYVREHGYSKSEEWFSFYWQVINIDQHNDPHYGNRSFVYQLNCMEFLRMAYTDIGLPLPRFVVPGRAETIAYLKTRYWMATSKRFEGTVKEHYYNVFRQGLEDIAIWNLPIRSPKDCGFLAFTLGTRYNALSYLSYDQKDFIYKNPGRWNTSLLEAENHSQKHFVDQDLDADEAKYIMAFLKGRGIPCREVETRSELEKEESELPYKLFFSDEEREVYTDRSRRKTIRYCSFDIGLVQYLEEEYTEYLLSDECMEYGDMLLREMTEDDPNDTTSHTGLIVKLIDPHDLEVTLSNANLCHVNYGHPRDWRFRLPYSKGIYFVTPYYNIALTFSNSAYFNDSGHVYNSSDMLYSELRGFSPAYDGRMWRANQSKDCALKGYAPRSYTNDLVQRGLLVSNDGMDIPIADDETFSQSY